jgi:hypothetical protein
MYLFIINTIFIALATFLTVKFLRFPMLKYANSKRRRFISRIATLLAILAMVPAGLTFVDVLRETNFEREAKDFIEKEVGSLDLKYFESIKRNSISKYIDKDDKFIEFNTYGLGEIPEITITLLKNKLKNYPNLTDAKLYFNQDGETGLDKFKYVEQLRARDSIDLIVKNNRIASLELEAKELSVLKRYTVQFDKLSQEAKINYENIDEMSYYTKVTTNFSKMDTLLVFDIKWKDGSNVSQESINTDMKRVEKWLKFKLDLDTLIVKRVR